MSEGDPEGARIYIVAYVSLFRVTDDLSPLQLDGRHDQDLSTIDWPSEVSVSPLLSAVSLRTCKNATHGALVRRRCLCTAAPATLLRLCTHSTG